MFQIHVNGSMNGENSDCLCISGSCNQNPCDDPSLNCNFKSTQGLFGRCDLSHTTL